MEVALIRRWASARRRWAKVVRFSEVPEENRGVVIYMRMGKPVTPPVPRCDAGLPKSNKLGRVYFVQCFKRKTHGQFCRLHRGGQRNHTSREAQAAHQAALE